MKARWPCGFVGQKQPRGAASQDRSDEWYRQRIVLSAGYIWLWQLSFTRLYELDEELQHRFILRPNDNADQSITSGSPDISSPPAISYSVQFFPEGGHLVADVRSEVAFRVESSTGTGANLAGAVLNNTGDTVVTFKPERFGIGYFYFTPQAGQKYRAILKTGAHNIAPATFPDIQPDGYAIHLSDGGRQRYAYLQDIEAW